MLVTALTRSLSSTGQCPTPSCPTRRSENSIYLVVRSSQDVLMPTHGARNLATMDALAGRVPAGGAGGTGGSFVGWKGHACTLLLCVHVRGCGSVRLWLEPPWGCRCTPILHVAVPRGGGVTQLWHWGGSVLFAACLRDRNGSARARRTLVICDRVCGTVSVTRRLRLQVESLCIFLCCFDLSKPSTFTCVIPICELRHLKISSPPPTTDPRCHRPLLPPRLCTCDGCVRAPARRVFFNTIPPVACV